jgi:hypothetical protein
LKSDPNFLKDYISELYINFPQGFSGSHRNLSFVWEVENIEALLENVFDFVIEKESYFGILPHFCNVFFRNINKEYTGRAKNFLLDYTKNNYSNSDKMNVVVDIVRNSLPELFEEILLLFLSKCQEKDIFSQIWWRGNGGTYSGDVIIGDIEASDWQNILSIVNKSDLGIKLIPIKKYINEKIERSLEGGDWERQRRFLGEF